MLMWKSPFYKMPSHLANDVDIHCKRRYILKLKITFIVSDARWQEVRKFQAKCCRTVNELFWELHPLIIFDYQSLKESSLYNKNISPYYFWYQVAIAELWTDMIFRLSTSNTESFRHQVGLLREVRLYLQMNATIQPFCWNDSLNCFRNVRMHWSQL